jgi:hypothetical protein
VIHASQIGTPDSLLVVAISPAQKRIARDGTAEGEKEAKGRNGQRNSKKRLDIDLIKSNNNDNIPSPAQEVSFVRRPSSGFFFFFFDSVLLRSMSISERTRVSFPAYTLHFRRSPSSLFDHSAQRTGPTITASDSILAAAHDARSH